MRARWKGRRHPPRGLALVMLGLVGLLTFILAAHSTTAREQRSRPSQGQTLNSSLRLTLSVTSHVWYGRQVYKLTNQSQVALRQIVVYNWSNQVLAPLEIGLTPQIDLNTCRPLTNPPYSLPAGNSLWFAGSTPPPAKFTVMWNSPQGTALYQVLAVSNKCE